jgi:hypothetical protein
MFSLFRKNDGRRTELEMLMADEQARKSLRESRRQWAIEQATYIFEGEGSVDEVLRAAKRLYFEAFVEEWGE